MGNVRVEVIDAMIAPLVEFSVERYRGDAICGEGIGVAAREITSNCSIIRRLFEELFEFNNVLDR
jgi:hypothetical protein